MFAVQKSSVKSAGKAGLALTLMTGLFLAIGCGGGGNGLSASPTPTPGTATANNTQVRIGDAPADSVIAFEVSLSSLSLTPSNGGAAVSIPVPANNRIELTHASGKFQPLTLGNLPQGSFSSANLTLANAELTFLTGTGTAVHINGPASAQVTVPLSPAVTIGSSPIVLAIDVNVANSVTLSGTTITGISFGPTSFNITAKAPGAQANQQDDDGEIEDVQGLVTAVNGSNFTMNVGQTGSSLTFATDASTEFKDGLTTLASALNQVVTVEGFTRSDGTLFAKEVEGLENENGAELEGIITQISGSTLTVMAQDGIGNGMDDTKVGDTFTVSIAGLKANKFRVNLGNGFGGSNLPSATFPFDATTIQAGQRIEVDTDFALPPANGSINVDKIKLQQQGVAGTVQNLSGATFDLALATDSALTVISGQSVVHVTTVGATDDRASVTNGASVRVRGLLFWNGTSWQMIARRIR